MQIAPSFSERPARLTRSIALLLCLALPAITPACMGYRSHIDANAARYAEVIGDSPTQSGKRLLLTVSVRHASITQEMQEKRRATIEEQGLEFLRASGSFAQVETELENPDLELVLNVEENEHYSQGMAMLSGFTLMLIPVSDRVETNASGEVFDSTGKSIAKLQTEQSMTAWLGLLFFPLIPTMSIAQSNSQKDLFRSVLVQMREQNAI